MEEREDAKVEMKTRVKRAGDGELDITPMIDITFLLLAFFVVVSKMDPTTLVNMPAAKFGDSIPEKTAVIVVVEASDGDAPIVYRGKSKTPAARCGDTIEALEEQLGEYVQQEMEADALKVAVIIKAEKKVKYRHLDIVKRAVSKSMTEEQTINVGIEEK